MKKKNSLSKENIFNAKDLNIVRFVDLLTCFI